MQLTDCFLIVLCLLFCTKILRAKSGFKPLISLLVIYILYEMIHTKIMYGDLVSLFDMLYRCIGFFSLPIALFFLSGIEANYKWMLSTIKKVGTVVLIFLYFIAEIYRLYGIQIIEEIRERSGMPRIDYGIEFLTIVWLICLSEICREINGKIKIKKSTLFFMIFETLYLVFINQTRLLLLFEIFSILVAIIFVVKSVNKKIIFVIIGLLIVAILIVLPQTSHYIFGLKNMFSSNDSSMYARISQMEYYPALIKEKPLLGYGTISGVNFSGLITGNLGVYCPEDLGVIGFTFFFGIIGTILYFSIVLLYIKKSIKYRRKCTESFFIEMFFVYSSITMVMFDIHRSAFPILLLTLIEGGFKYYEKNN